MTFQGEKKNKEKQLKKNEEENFGETKVGKYYLCNKNNKRLK